MSSLVISGVAMDVSTGSGVVVMDTNNAAMLVGDILEIRTTTLPTTNFINSKVVSVDYGNGFRFTVSYTGFVAESNVIWRVMRSWLTADTAQKHYGHLCDEGTGKFSNGNNGFTLL